MAESMDSAPNSEFTLNKSEVKYRGVRKSKSGKFVADIYHPKTRATVWLGTFNSAIEAAKAFDKAAFDFRGQKATLNFPLQSPPESLPSGRKHDGVTVKTTEGKPNGPVHAVTLSSSSTPSPLIGSDDNGNRGRYKWTDESLVALCDILNKHIATNGRNCAFKWPDHLLEFETLSGHKFNSLMAFRSRYEAMRVRHSLWKLLKDGEIGLRWDETEGKLDCSDDWWESKVQENPDFCIFWKKQPSRKLQEAWDLLFDNVLSNGLPYVEMNKSKKQVHYVNLEDDDEDEDIVHVSSSEHTLHSSEPGNVETKEATYFSNFVNKERREDGLAPKQGDECQSSQKIDKTKETERAAMLKKLKTGEIASQQSGLKTVKTSSVKQVGDSSISTCMSVVNGMVDEGLMASCSELWCFAVNLFEDDVKRELFMSLPNDAGRLAWLQFKQNLGN